MAAILTALCSKYRQVIDEYAVSYSGEYFLMGSPWPMIAILIAYNYFCLSLGPRLMKNRAAFKINGIVQIYNLSQVVLCLYQNHYIYRPETKYSFPFFNVPVEYGDNEYGRFAYERSHVYFMMKFFDLIDTVVFVLRKKNSQITFLHMYHHNIMAFGAWVFMKFWPAGQAIFIAYINNYVHAIMYTYYFVTSRWPQYKKNIWWKKYVTQIQMIQFLLNALHSFPMLFLKEVHYPRAIAFFLFVENLLMFTLFYDFYRKAYKKKKVV